LAIDDEAAALFETLLSLDYIFPGHDVDRQHTGSTSPLPGENRDR
jgi:hypothetical protein